MLSRVNERLEREIRGLSVLAEPVRRALYFFVARRRREVGRDEAAEALDISRSLAAFHLDKLVEERLLEADYRRLSGKSGPGAGRPAKVYRRAARQLDVSIPPRRYELAARLLASAAERGEPVDRVARALGKDLGAEARAAAGPRARRDALARAAVETLEDYGFEPERERGGVVRLRNCPFDALAREHRAVVCGMNLSLLRGVVDGLRESGLRAESAPDAAACCVRLTRR